MTQDELETRITRLEIRQNVLTALVHTLLPGIPRASRAVVLEQFQQYCSKTEAAVFSQDWPPLEADLMNAALEEMSTSLRTAIRLIDASEQTH